MFSPRQDPPNPLVLSRQIQQSEANRQRLRERVRILRPFRWYDTVAPLGLLRIPFVQYLAYFSTLDLNWFYIPLVAGLSFWATVSVWSPASAPVRLPLSWSRAAFIAGLAALLVRLACEENVRL